MKRGRKPNGTDGSTILRDQVFQTIVESRKPVTTAEINALLGRKDNGTVRMMIYHLEQTGFLEHGVQRGKRNRPAAKYYATPTQEAVDRLKLRDKRHVSHN